MTKLLVIRFSSIGDILQCIPAIHKFKDSFPDAEIHWLTRSDMAPLLSIDPVIDRIWKLEREGGFNALLKIALSLRKESFTYVYDAHSNIRSAIVKIFLYRSLSELLNGGGRIVTRYKYRIKRFLLFKLRINLFPNPFKGAVSYIEPLKRFRSYSNQCRTTIPEINFRFPPDVIQKIEERIASIRKRDWICLVPSAAWDLKRWPLEYWKRIVALLPDMFFVIIGGPMDFFCGEIAGCAPERTVDLSGKTSIIESLYVVYIAPFLISGDTGYMHAADLFSKKGIALIGPTAFGFPSNNTLKVASVDLTCRPCSKDGRGKCRNRIRKQCMKDITPEVVAEMVRSYFYTSHVP